MALKGGEFTVPLEWESPAADEFLISALQVAFMLLSPNRHKSIILAIGKQSDPAVRTSFTAHQGRVTQISAQVTTKRIALACPSNKNRGNG
jgi:hypothetical protein